MQSAERQPTMEAPAFIHPALLWGSLDEFLHFMVPFVAGGIEYGEPVFVAVGAEPLAALRDEIGASASGVQWVDTNEWHPHPGTRLRAFHELVTEELEAGARRIRLVGEPVWPVGRPELLLEWQRYESVLNEVLAPFRVTLVCTYETSRLDRSIVATARRTHPTFDNGEHHLSMEFVDPAHFLRRWQAELPPPPADALRMREPLDLAAARRFVTEEATRAGVTLDRALDLRIAANEILTNALVHGHGRVELAVWFEDGRFVCQMEDRGPGIADPFASYRPPPTDGTSGRGLWLARQLVDLLLMNPTSSGTTVRLYIDVGVTRSRAAEFTSA